MSVSAVILIQEAYTLTPLRCFPLLFIITLIAGSVALAV